MCEGAELISSAPIQDVSASTSALVKSGVGDIGSVVTPHFDDAVLPFKSSRHGNSRTAKGSQLRHGLNRFSRVDIPAAGCCGKRVVL